MEITKTEFETYLAVAVSSHEDVYDKVKPQFASTYDECKNDVLGAVGTAAGENNETPLCNVVKGWVSVRAFLSVFRQLDLVLTPTGFGVVSTQQMAPASKQRVDALIGQLRDYALQVHGRLLEELRKVQGWGATSQAKENISTLFYDFRQMKKMQGPGISHLEWQAAQRLIGEADDILRLKLSNQYMDTLLDQVRCNSLTPQNETVVSQCIHIINMWIIGEQTTVKLKMRRLLALLDADKENYPIYHQYGYPVNHHETFQNTQDAPAYVFG